MQKIIHGSHQNIFQLILGKNGWKTQINTFGRIKKKVLSKNLRKITYLTQRKYLNFVNFEISNKILKFTRL